MSSKSKRHPSQAIKTSFYSGLKIIAWLDTENKDKDTRAQAAVNLQRYDWRHDDRSANKSIKCSYLQETLGLAKTRSYELLADFTAEELTGPIQASRHYHIAKRALKLKEVAFKIYNQICKDVSFTTTGQKVFKIANLAKALRLSWDTVANNLIKLAAEKLITYTRSRAGVVIRVLPEVPEVKTKLETALKSTINKTQEQPKAAPVKETIKRTDPPSQGEDYPEISVDAWQAARAALGF